MRENFVQSMAKQVEAQLHEESKLWSFIALCEANQVYKEENQRRNLVTSNFAWLCKIFSQHVKSRGASIVTGQRVGMSERNFAHHAKPSCVISRYLCTDSVRIYLQIFCVISQFLLVINLDIFFYIFLYIFQVVEIYKERYV